MAKEALNMPEMLWEAFQPSSSWWGHPFQKTKKAGPNMVEISGKPENSPSFRALFKSTFLDLRGDALVVECKTLPAHGVRFMIASGFCGPLPHLKPPIPSWPLQCAQLSFIWGLIMAPHGALTAFSIVSGSRRGPPNLAVVRSLPNIAQQIKTKHDIT